MIEGIILFIIVLFATKWFLEFIWKISKGV